MSSTLKFCLPAHLEQCSKKISALGIRDGSWHCPKHANVIYQGRKKCPEIWRGHYKSRQDEDILKSKVLLGRKDLGVGTRQQKLGRARKVMTKKIHLEELGKECWGLLGTGKESSQSGMRDGH